MKLTPSRSFSSFLFNKGRLTLEKLQDKCLVDGSIDHVSIAFPDQYGRFWSTQVNAEYFIQKVKAGEHFTFQGNPFNQDLLGKEIDMPDSIQFDVNLELKVDISTLKQGELAQSGAFVLSDPTNFALAPRSILKSSIERMTDQIDPQIDLAFAVGLQKFKPDENTPSPQDQGLSQQGWSQNFQIATSVESTLRSNGIPITQFQHIGGEFNQTKFQLYKKSKQNQEDLIMYADAYHMAKWLVKNEAVSSGYVANFIPSEGGKLYLESSIKPQNIISKLGIYLPTLNSIRKVCQKTDKETFGLEILQTDTNLYRVFADLIGQVDNSQTLVMPQTFREAIKLLEQQIEEQEDDYYNRILAHEIKQIYEQQTSKELDRVY